MAFLLYLSLAERGFEVAQSNAAYLLDQHLVTFLDADGADARALYLWKLSADQGHAPARVKLGDYHYYGRGTEVNYVAAAHEYQQAVTQRNAQAMFNLGVMHQMGTGLPRDLHLAKRFYDMAADTSTEARLPTSLALASMQVQAYVEQLLSGDEAVGGYYAALLQALSEYVKAPPKVEWEDLTWDNVDRVVQV